MAKFSGCGRALFTFALGMFGLCALGVAEFNLLGVPMIERSMMHAGTGWMALAVAAICFVGCWWLMRRTT